MTAAIACQPSVIVSEPDERGVTEHSTTGGATPGSTEQSVEEARIGQSMTLQGQRANSATRVNVLRVVDPAAPDNEFVRPEGRFVAVQVRLENVGTVPYDDFPDNGVKLLDQLGQQFSTAMWGARDCPGFSGTVKMSPGDSRLGCFVFDVPTASLPSTFQFAADSGFGPQTGQWKLR